MLPALPAVLQHNDLGPWNLIAGPTWAFIDWDIAAPGRRFWDLAWAMHTLVGLWPELWFPHHELARRITVFCDAAAVERADRSRLLETVVERTAFSAQQCRRLAADGHPAYARLVADEHPEVWERGSQFVAEHLRHWARLTR